jgi:hypothetical protein
MTHSSQAGQQDPMQIGGAPLVTLRCPAPGRSAEPRFVAADVLPGRGMMLLQARAMVPSMGEVDVLASRTPERAREAMDGSAADFNGNASFAFGAANLAPFANRIRGSYDARSRTIETEIGAGPTRTRVRLPANGGGKAAGAEQYAIHGLILARPFADVERETRTGSDRVRGVLHGGDFDGQWVSATDLAVEITLRPDTLTLAMTATNVGTRPAPIGLGWHPYFSIPSGRREQARLHLPVRRRVVVNDYDEVLPTGELVPVSGTPYDYAVPGGALLGSGYLDDCFVGLEKGSGGVDMRRGSTNSTIRPRLCSYRG